MDALAERAAVGVADLLAGETEDLVEEGAVLRGELVGGLTGLAVAGEGGLLVEEVANVRTAALHEVAGEAFAALGVLEVHVTELGVEEGEQVAEALLLAGVRGGGDEDEVPGGVLGEVLEQLVALVAGGAAAAVGHRGVSLVHDDQLGRPVEELEAAVGGLDEVGGDDSVGVPLEQGLVHHEAALQAADGGGEDELGVDGELLAELALPLLGERG